MWRQTWAEINLQHFAHNVSILKKQLLPHVRFMATVKADAYGHGAVEISKTALRAGAQQLGVASFEEGAVLREASITADILVFGALSEEGASAALAHRLTASVGSMQDLLWLQEAAEACHKQARIHVKIDTGMTRLGLRHIEDVVQLVQVANESSRIILEGIYTHFATSDEELFELLEPSDQENGSTIVPFVEQQRMRFEEVLQAVRELGIIIPIVHAANSAAALRNPRYQYDMVRFGIAMYGYQPLPIVDADLTLHSVMAVRSRITRIVDIVPGEAVSYGRTYIATRPEVIATVAIGYGDGIPRDLSNLGRVLVNGQCAQIVGRVCMDQLMIKVTDLVVQVGDIVTLYGADEGCGSILQATEQLDTIPYELLCRITARVPRVIIPAENLAEDRQ
ncbi:MAG: alanine racemase [Acidibacillus sp.]|nr:alanine racemase [Acidibacillus sp.]